MLKLAIKDLSAGMILGESIYDPQTKKLLLKLNTSITDDMIKVLKNHDITEVSVLEKYTLAIDPSETTRVEVKNLLKSEIHRLVSDRVEANPSDKITDVAKKSLLLVDQISDDYNVIDFCVQMKLSDNDYLYKHCISSCALSVLIAGAMGLSPEEIKNIGKAALLHDLGMCEMPTIIRLGKRNHQEEMLWQEHPKYGFYFAKEKGFSDEIIKIVLHHHEQWNGSGFPDKLAGEEIPMGSRILSVCETYDRLLRYDKFPHYQAIEYLYGAGNYIFDSKVVNAFTNNLAVYPLGSMVRLSTGEVGVIVNVRKNLGPRPVVKVYFNRFNKPMTSPKEVDLGQERTILIQEVL